MDIADIDDGSYLAAAKEGDIKPLIKRLINRKFLDDDSLKWIADRLEGKNTASIKRGTKKSKNIYYRNLERYIIFRWLMDVENYGKEIDMAHADLAKIYNTSAEVIRKQISPFKKAKIGAVAIVYAQSLGGDTEMFKKTKLNIYRPIPLRILEERIY